MDNAKSVVQQTLQYAEVLGKALADQDMLELAFKALANAGEVAQAFRAYETIHSYSLWALENRIGDFLSKPDVIAADKRELGRRYTELKRIVRERYEASWVPTELDLKEQNLSQIFVQAAEQLQEMSLNGRGGGKNDKGPLIPSLGDRPSSPEKTVCSFMANSPEIPTDGGSRSATYHPGQAGTFTFSCPGPEGQNDWISAANWLGEGASFAWSGALETGNPYVYAAAIILTALSLISGTVGALISGSQIEEETRLATEAEIYKFTHVAVPENIAAAYRRRAAHNVVLLREAATDVAVVIKGPEGQRRALLERYAKQRDQQLAFEKFLAKLDTVKCRLNARGQNPPFTTSVTSCPLGTSDDHPNEAAEDCDFYSKNKDVPIERHWGYLKFKIVEILAERGSMLTQAQEREIWRRVDVHIEQGFTKLIGWLNVVTELRECEVVPEASLFRDALNQSTMYAGLRRRFLILVSDAIKVSFGRLSKAQYMADLRSLESDVDSFIKTDGAKLDGVSNLSRSIALLRRRSA